MVNHLWNALRKSFFLSFRKCYQNILVQQECIHFLSEKLLSVDGICVLFLFCGLKTKGRQGQSVSIGTLVVFMPSPMQYFLEHYLGVLPLIQSVEVVCLIGILRKVIELPPVHVGAPVWLLSVELRVQEVHPLSEAVLRGPHRVAWTKVS